MRAVRLTFPAKSFRSSPPVQPRCRTPPSFHASVRLGSPRQNRHARRPSPTMQNVARGSSRLGVGLQRQGRTTTSSHKSSRFFAPAHSQWAQRALKLRTQSRCRPGVVCASSVPSAPALPESSQASSNAPLSALGDENRVQQRRLQLRLGAGIALCLGFFALTSGAAHAATTDASKGWLAYLVSFVLHLDKHLNAIVAEHGTRTYAILFAIVFAETGLVVTPFLPGDSLLFAAGTLCAMGSLNLFTLIGLLFIAAVLGDTLNYAIGKKLGSAVFTADSKIFRREYVRKTEDYFAKHGAKTARQIVLARFVPIVRTFAPFIAGVGTMAYSTFVLYNIVGAAIWTGVFSVAGYLFGGLPFVQKNFTLVVLAIVIVSVVPVILEILEARKEANSHAK